MAELIGYKRSIGLFDKELAVDQSFQGFFDQTPFVFSKQLRQQCDVELVPSNRCNLEDIAAEFIQAIEASQNQTLQTIWNPEIDRFTVLIQCPFPVSLLDNVVIDQISQDFFQVERDAPRFLQDQLAKMARYIRDDK